MDLKEAIVVAEKLQAGLLGQKEGGIEKKVVEEEKGLVAPVFQINIDPEMCNRIVMAANSYSGSRNLETGVREESKRQERNEEGCWKCGEYGHRAFECRREVLCFKCRRVGHRAVDCNTPHCMGCGRYGHTKERCWTVNPQLRSRGGSLIRGRGRARGNIRANMFRGRGIASARGSSSKTEWNRNIERGKEKENPRVIAPVMEDDKHVRISVKIP